MVSWIVSCYIFVIYRNVCQLTYSLTNGILLLSPKRNLIELDFPNGFGRNFIAYDNSVTRKAMGNVRKPVHPAWQSKPTIQNFSISPTWLSFPRTLKYYFPSYIAFSSHNFKIYQLLAWIFLDWWFYLNYSFAGR